MAQPIFRLSRHTRHELFDAIMRTLNEMPSDLRRVFVSCHYQGHLTSEVAAEMNLSQDEINELLCQANLRFFEGLRGLRLDS